MLTYHHILIATDFSEYSLLAIERAHQMAKTSTHTKLSIIHVIELSPVAYGEFTIPINANLEQQWEARARAELARIGRPYGITPDNQYVEKGLVRTAVIELAEKLKVDLIVVGTHGHSGLGVLLGSRTNAILHYAKCDVLVVRKSK